MLTEIEQNEIRFWMEIELSENWRNYDDPELVAGNLVKAALDHFLVIAEEDLWEFACEAANEYNADNEIEGESWNEQMQGYWRAVMGR